MIQGTCLVPDILVPAFSKRADGIQKICRKKTTRDWKSDNVDMGVQKRMTRMIQVMNQHKQKNAYGAQ